MSGVLAEASITKVLMVSQGANNSFMITQRKWQPEVQIVWLARPSHLIAGALRAGKERSSGSND